MNILMYLDPASGTVILQAVLSGVFAAFFFFNSFFKRVFHSVQTWFSRKAKKESGQRQEPV